MQNQLLVLIAALRGKTGNAPDTSPLEFLEAMINSSEAFEEAGQTPHLARELTELQQRWSGIVDIITHLDPDIEIANRTAPVMTIAEEAVSNSIRHGLASTVRIQVSQAQNHIEMTVDDDGVGPRSGRAGLGTQQLEDASSSWSLTLSPLLGGARLKASIPHRSK